jgi:hypothetical protein
MQALIMKYVKFKNCYYLLFIYFLFLWISLLLFILPNTSFGPLNIIYVTGITLLTLYIALGFIKYSLIVNEDLFRNIVIIIIFLVLIHSFLMFLHNVLNINPLKSFYGNSLNLLELLQALSFYYAFKLILNDEFKYFRRLSTLNLILVIMGLCFSMVLLLNMFHPPSLISSIGLLLFFLSMFAISFLICYWEIRLFRHLYFKYEVDR